MLPDVAVTTVVPALIAFTTPLEFTVATALLLDAHLTVLTVAFEGETVAFNLAESPTVSFFSEALSLTFVTATFLTLILQYVDFFLLFLPVTVTVILAVPAFFATILPLLLTVATDVLLDL